MSQFEKEIEEKLLPLSIKAKAIFAVLTCEMLYPNYVDFTQRTGWGNSKLLSDAISLIHIHLINSDLISISEIEDMMARIDLTTPDTEDFSDITTSFALEACTSIYSTLQFLLDENMGHLVEVVSFALDTIDSFIQEKEGMNSIDPSRDIQIENDDFMLREKKRQRELIAQLSKMNLDIITDDMMASLRTKHPIIDLSLLPPI